MDRLVSSLWSSWTPQHHDAYNTEYQCLESYKQWHWQLHRLTSTAQTQIYWIITQSTFNLMYKRLNIKTFLLTIQNDINCWTISRKNNSDLKYDFKRRLHFRLDDDDRNTNWVNYMYCSSVCLNKERNLRNGISSFDLYCTHSISAILSNKIVRMWMIWFVLRHTRHHNDCSRTRKVDNLIQFTKPTIKHRLQNNFSYNARDTRWQLSASLILGLFCLICQVASKLLH